MWSRAQEPAWLDQHSWAQSSAGAVHAAKDEGGEESAGAVMGNAWLESALTALWALS